MECKENLHFFQAMSVLLPGCLSRFVQGNPGYFMIVCRFLASLARPQSDDLCTIIVDMCVLTVYSHSYRNAANAVESLEANKHTGEIVIAQFKQFKVVIKEIPNQHIARGVNYKQEYVITADNATEAKQDALDRFGDYSKVESCSEIDHDYPEQYVHEGEE